MEIERKWKLLTVPDAEPDSIFSVVQRYLCAGDVEVRVRMATCLKQGKDKPMSKYLLTIKGPGDLSRQEVNIELTQVQWGILHDLIRKTPIHKDFYTYFYDGHRIEVSIVDQQFIYAEVEFDSEEEANKFVWPWPETKPIEVTYDSSHKMKNYWNRTRLDK